MKVKFTRYERTAGLFVLFALVGGLLSTVGVAIKQGWFEKRMDYIVKLNSADGIRQGTVVLMAGLRVGSIKSVDLLKANEVVAVIAISEAYAGKIRSDSIVKVSRPFVIGEKVFDITPGSEGAQALAENKEIPVQYAPDLLDLASGKTLAPYFSTMGKVADNLRIVAEAFADNKRLQSFIGIFDEAGPFIHQANILLKGMNKDQRTIAAIDNLTVMTKELNQVLPHLTKNTPELAKDMTKIAKNMAVLTDELQKILPAFNKIAPKLPEASERALEALDETVITLKALQKSFLFRGGTKEVREEEGKLRGPAGAVPGK